MLISCNWLKKYIKFNLTISELDNILTMLGIEVEHTKDMGMLYKGFYVGKVLSKEKHPNADKLSLCSVSIGNSVKQIVCGAPNVAKGQKVVVGMLGAIVPLHQFKLERRKIRDIYSEGMICSQQELELGDDSSGIWVLPDDAPVGVELADYLELNDIILDVSLTPNKSDCLSHIGIAREIAAYLRSNINIEEISFSQSKNKTSKEIKVEIEDTDLCPRYIARIIKNVKNSESPQWLKSELQKVGLRSRNIIVDVTNYVLMDLGQPLHSFDFDKIKGNKIIVKKCESSSKFITLDGKERQLEKEMLMICDTEKPIAIAGVMGGQNSEIDSNSTNVILESAFFNPSSIRKTAKKLGLSTDASYRFERGCDIDIVVYAIDKAAKLIAELGGGEILSDIVEEYPHKIKPKKITFRFDYARRIIGTDISNNEMQEIFLSLGFDVANKKDIQKAKSIDVIVPNRRVDIFSEIDLIEEVARLINYDTIAPNFSSNISFIKDEIPNILKPLPLQNKIRNYLANNGFIELLTPNIIDPSSAKLTYNRPIRIENPLGEEMSAMRPSIIPPLLKVISYNIRQGNSNLKLFETGKIFISQNNISNSFIDNIDEREELVIGLTGNVSPRQWSIADRHFDFFDIKGEVFELLQYLNIPNFKFKPITNNNIYDLNSAEIYSSNILIGFVGGILKSVLQKYEIENPVFVANMDLTAINELKIKIKKYEPISPYPIVKRDLAFIINDDISANEIIKLIKSKTNKLLKNVSVFDLYKGKNIPSNQKSIAFELIFSSNERTLIDEEIETNINKIISALEHNFKAELRK